MSTSRIYLSPGLFGFGSLGNYDYFSHVEKGLRARFHRAGRTVEVHRVGVHPTASIRRRASVLLASTCATADGEGAIHLLGHSTGGLDARLVASPTMNVGATRPCDWSRRLRSVTTVNTPHYGTPLASFFATLSGQRLLYAVSALTVAVLKLGKPPLALSSSLVAAFLGIERAAGLQLKLIDRLADNLVSVLDGATSEETADFLRLLRQDQGAIIQLSPESMDMFQAGVEDDDSVHYQCSVSFAPAPGVVQWAKTIIRPWSRLSLPVFALLHGLTSREHERYPCASADPEAENLLVKALGFRPPPNANDGVVPLRSQIWGKVVWAGMGDHLDVVGHFQDGSSVGHVDWLSSGAGFNRERFEAMLDAIADGMLQSEL